MAEQEVAGCRGMSAAAPTTLESPDVSADLEEWKLGGFDQMEAGWASI